jgi:GNAT superfamily N-acetyltransferase
VWSALRNRDTVNMIGWPIMSAKPQYPSDHEPHIEVRPALGRFDDFAVVVGTQRPDAGGCWCMAYRDSSVAGPERPDHMRRECANDPGPGVLVYVDDVVAGWCSIAPRTSYRRLLNSRTIPILDDHDAWIAVCFVVRGGYRKHGLMHHLLAGAVGHAASHGAEVVEGYPVEVGGGRVDGISGYVGTVDLFERAGFERAAPTTSRSGGQPRWVMRKTLR